MAMSTVHASGLAVLDGATNAFRKGQVTFGSRQVSLRFSYAIQDLIQTLVPNYLPPMLSQRLTEPLNWSCQDV
jgi:hypothetical protein